MSLYGLDLESYERTRRAVRWAEGQYDGAPVAHDSAGVIEADSEVWFQTDSVAPGGYSGSAWFPGTIKRVKSTGSTVTIGPGLIKDLNAKALTPSTIYRGLFAQMVLDGGALKPAFFVTGFVDGPGVGVKVGYYNGGAVYGINGIEPRKTDIVVDGSTLTISGHPWGQDAPAAFASAPVLGSDGRAGWSVILRDTLEDTWNYHIVPFSFPAIVKFSHSNGTPVVACKNSVLSSVPFSYLAIDPARLVPNPGVFRAMLTTYVWIDYLAYIGFAVVSVNTAAPVAASSGVSLSGSAFPSGMGGAFPGLGAPSTAVDPVE